MLRRSTPRVKDTQGDSSVNVWFINVLRYKEPVSSEFLFFRKSNIMIIAVIIVTVIIIVIVILQWKHKPCSEVVPIIPELYLRFSRIKRTRRGI